MTYIDFSRNLCGQMFFELLAGWSKVTVKAMMFEEYFFERPAQVQQFLQPRKGGIFRQLEFRKASGFVVYKKKMPCLVPISPKFP